MQPENNWTIPNILTVFRILLTPVFVMSFVSSHVHLALLVFTLAGVSDALDGALARVLHQRTRLGAMLDPLADKVLIVTGFLCLGIVGWAPDWLVVLVISRDVIIVGGLGVLHFWGVEVRATIRPSALSKVNTTAQLVFLFLVLTDRAGMLSLPGTQATVMVLVSVLTVVTGVSYVLRGLSLFPTQED
jgi:cardiolipin synthase